MPAHQRDPRPGQERSVPAGAAAPVDPSNPKRELCHGPERCGTAAPSRLPTPAPAHAPRFPRTHKQLGLLRVGAHAGVAHDADGHAGAQARQAARQARRKVRVAVEEVVGLVLRLVDCVAYRAGGGRWVQGWGVGERLERRKRARALRLAARSTRQLHACFPPAAVLRRVAASTARAGQGFRARGRHRWPASKQAHALLVEMMTAMMRP